MPGEATVASLLEQYAPLTEAEAGLVLRRQQADDAPSLDELVAQVKAERVGPARHWESEAAAAVPVDEDLEVEPDTDPVVVMDPDTKVETIVDPALVPEGEIEVEEDVPDGTVAEILEWVGEDAGRARKAIDAELVRDDARSTLLTALEPVAGDDEEDQS